MLLEQVYVQVTSSGLRLELSEWPGLPVHRQASQNGRQVFPFPSHVICPTVGKYFLNCSVKKHHQRVLIRNSFLGLCVGLGNELGQGCHVKWAPQSVVHRWFTDHTWRNRRSHLPNVTNPLWGSNSFLQHLLSLAYFSGIQIKLTVIW